MRLTPEREKEIWNPEEGRVLASIKITEELLAEIDALREELENADYGEQAVILCKERDRYKAALERILNGKFHIGNDEHGNIMGLPDAVICRKIASEALV
jgi:hypothetical protein